MLDYGKIKEKIFLDIDGRDPGFTHEEQAIMESDPDSTHNFYARVYAELARKAYDDNPRGEQFKLHWKACCNHIGDIRALGMQRQTIYDISAHPYLWMQEQNSILMRYWILG